MRRRTNELLEEYAMDQDKIKQINELMEKDQVNLLIKLFKKQSE